MKQEPSPHQRVAAHGIPARLAGVLVAIAAALVAADSAPGQITNMDINSDLPYTFLPPGARAAGMGGAFTALADDATAAYSNPAGLLGLSRPEASLEVRHQRFSTPIADGPGTYGVLPDGTLSTAPPYTNFESDSTGPSFVSYTFPRPAWSVGFFRAEVSRFTLHAQTETIEGPGPYRDLAPSDIEADLLLEVYGAAAAWRVAPKFWLGGAVTVQRMDFGAHQLDRGDSDLQWGQRASARDEGVAGTVGLLWLPSDAWRLGAAFRSGAQLDAEYSFTCGTRPTGARPFLCRRDGIPDGEPVPSLSGRTTFKVPDVLSVGIAYRLTDSITASLQYDRIAYSQMVDGLRNSLTVASDLGAYEIEDADDLHFGVEGLASVGAQVLTLRAGAWLERKHSLRYRSGVVADPGREEVAVALFSTPIGDEWHATAGLGITAGARLQFDAAADFSKYRDSYVLSAVMRF